MTEPLVFWLLAGLLALLALAFIWYPLLRQRHSELGRVDTATLNIQAYRSQLQDLDAELEAQRINTTQYQSLKTELERNMLQDFPATEGADSGRQNGKPAWIVTTAASLLVLGLTTAFYLELGSSQVLATMGQQRALAEKLGKLPSAERIALLEQAAKQPTVGPEVWYSLAREYLNAKRFAEAGAAYEKLLNLAGEQAEILAEYAQVLFLIAGNRITPQVKNLLDRTLKVQSDNATVLGILGIDAFENKRYQDAIGYWQRILEANPGMEGADALRVGIAKARAMLGEAETQQTEGQATGPELRVSVALTDTLKKLVAPQDVLFVFARAVNGPPMPLAAARLNAGSLPVELVLNDTMAMTPAAKLSSVEQVQLVARISKSGMPQAQPGDLQGNFGPVAVNTRTEIKIIIDNVVE